jgi:alkylhydroperoxidase family enzyme
MSLLRTIPPEEAEGKVKELYEKAGPLWQSFSLRPEAALTFHQLIKIVSSVIDDRIYELVYFLAASRAHCSVCTLGHGLHLVREYITADQLSAILEGRFDEAELDPGEVALLDFTDMLIRYPYKISERDIEALHEHGFKDESILDVILVAGIANYISVTANATHIKFSETVLTSMKEILGETLFRALQVGRTV